MTRLPAFMRAARNTVRLLCLGLCLSSLTARFIVDGVAPPVAAPEAGLCGPAADIAGQAEACDAHSDFVLPGLGLASPLPTLSLALASPDWRAGSLSHSPSVPPPKISSAA